MVQKSDAATNGLVRYGVEVKDFVRLKTLGTGSFSRVYLVKNHQQNYYALKRLYKAHIIKNKQIDHTLSERSILSRINFPFIVNLVCTFNDELNVYFLMEYAIGGELFTHLRRAGRFSNEMAKFYSGQITLAMEHLHGLDIIYRDLKPENILLDYQGNVKIADFGFAKVVPDRTWTFCGTAEYIAPEIIKSQGHGKAVDWWALGVLVFEMYPPFYHEEPLGIYQLIIAGKVNFPPHFAPQAVDIIRRFLTADLSKRLGNLQYGALQVKAHPWFESFNWDDLLAKNIRPPIVPFISGLGDTRNFDEYPDELPQQEIVPKEYEEYFKCF
ncbi:hypothetical protein HDV01_006367 [Terramyces sp. JEL0728]|nr:hypothetical protein HDV01_006367 [Terramyces sp. JEL0728]